MNKIEEQIFEFIIASLTYTDMVPSRIYLKKPDFEELHSIVRSRLRMVDIEHWALETREDKFPIRSPIGGSIEICLRPPL